jgi:hypothetical protein
MTVLQPRPSLSGVSTALLISAMALPISVVAFAVLYGNNDSFWAVLWLDAVLPVTWLAAAVLSIRDGVKRRSWRQIVGVVALLAPTGLLVNTTVSPRFALHQLFTFRPLDLHLPTYGFVFMEKFVVCAQGQPCKSQGVVSENRTFSIKTIPEGCCTLAVFNGRGQNKVDAFRVVLNGKEVKLESQKGAVDLSSENDINVELTGAPDAYLYVVVAYTGKKNTPPA